MCGGWDVTAVKKRHVVVESQSLWGKLKRTNNRLWFSSKADIEHG